MSGWLQVVSRSNIAVACAQEAMRLKPPLKLLFRTADEDTSCGDVAVPKGTTVALAIRQVNTVPPPPFMSPNSEVKIGILTTVLF